MVGDKMRKKEEKKLIVLYLKISTFILLRLHQRKLNVQELLFVIAI